MKIILLRHPLTQGNQAGWIYGQLDLPISQEGQASIPCVIRAMKDLTFERIISSSLIRAHELAKNIQQARPCPLTVDPRLGEMAYGVLEGLTPERAKLQEPEAFECFMNGQEERLSSYGIESYTHFKERLLGAFADYESTEENLLIVTHGGVIRTLLIEAMAMETDMVWQLPLEPAHYICLEKDPLKGSWRIL